MLDKVKRLMHIIAFALGAIFLADVAILIGVAFFDVFLDHTINIIPFAIAIAVAIPLGYLYIYRWIKKYIIEIKLVELELEEKEQRFRVLFEMGSDPIFVHRLNEDNSHGLFVEANKAACDKYGYSVDEILKMTAVDFVTEERRKILPKFMKEFSKHEQNMFEVRHIKKDGTIFPVELSSRTFKINGERFVIGTIRDITERKKDEERAKYLAYNDVLTDIPNRASFHEKFAEVLEDARKNNTTFSLFYLDIDDFKSINDRFGHNAGDTILQVVAKRLVNSIRVDDTVSRMGGDEFTMILLGSSKEELLHVIGRIHKNLEQTIHFEDVLIKIMVSIGSATFPADGADEETLLRNADNAMYIAKSKGNNNYHFYAAEDAMLINKDKDMTN